MVSRVRFTANFDSNLQSIRAFLVGCGAPLAYEDLIEYLFGELIPNLEIFPQLGRNFRDVEPQSTEGCARQHRVEKLAGEGADLREYVAGDYIVLYMVRRSTIFLLSIRHHRQLSFDLRAHWR